MWKNLVKNFLKKKKNRSKCTMQKNDFSKLGKDTTGKKKS